MFGKYLKDIHGAVMPTLALLLPVVIGMAGIGTDVSFWMMTRQDLQTAADAAAMAGAWEAARGADSDLISANAEKEAANNNYVSSLNGNINVEYDPETEMVNVTLEQDSYSFLTKVISTEPAHITVVAQASILPGTDDFCILSLEKTELGSLTTSGSVNLSGPPPINESISGVNPDKIWIIYRRHINGKEALYG